MGGKVLKIAALVLAVALVVCIPLLVDSTYATDANQISAPSDFKFYRTTGNRQTEITDGSSEPVFSNTLLEPGHTTVEYFTLTGTGKFEYGFQLSAGSHALSALAEAIDVYYLETDEPLTGGRQSALASMHYLGTLDKVIGNDELFRAEGNGSASFAVALQMRPSAGNAYQGLSLYTENDAPCCFNVILKAAPKN